MSLSILMALLKFIYFDDHQGTIKTNVFSFSPRFFGVRLPPVLLKGGGGSIGYYFSGSTGCFLCFFDQFPVRISALACL